MGYCNILYFVISFPLLCNMMGVFNLHNSDCSFAALSLPSLLQYLKTRNRNKKNTDFWMEIQHFLQTQSRCSRCTKSFGNGTQFSASLFAQILHPMCSQDRDEKCHWLLWGGSLKGENVKKLFMPSMFILQKLKVVNFGCHY